MTKHYYLEMSSSPASFEVNCRDMRICEAKIRQYQLNAMLYNWVGSDYDWRDKSQWTAQQWIEDVEHDNCRTWLAYINGSIAGYYELLKADDEVQLRYFGLTDKFIGLGYGGILLRHAISSAWQWQPVNRVWLHTCDKDHNHALANYQARGFQIYETKEDP